MGALDAPLDDCSPGHFLTVGIALGSWWAYYELGWGGFWFWDPVENASFMPWLVGTALVHSLAVTDKRGLFKSWTLLLAILAFSLSLLGTFLVRSGVLVSVHSFAADPTRGIFILVFLIIMIGGSLALYAWRAPLLRSTAGFELGARESFLLFNNILLVIAAAIVFGGTMAPLIADALGLPTLSVGPPYFNPTFLMPILPLLALLPVGLHANWKRGRLAREAARRFSQPSRSRSCWRSPSAWSIRSCARSHSRRTHARAVDHPLLAPGSRSIAGGAGSACRAPSSA